MKRDKEIPQAVQRVFDSANRVDYSGNIQTSSNTIYYIDGGRSLGILATVGKDGVAYPSSGLDDDSRTKAVDKLRAQFEKDSIPMGGIFVKKRK